MWKLHGLTDATVSDREHQFTATFWTQLCELLRIQPTLSTAFHPQTGKQTERANAVMEQYLHSYMTYKQKDWASFRRMAKLTAKNHVSETSGASPFLVNQVHHSRMNFALLPTHEPAPPFPSTISLAIWNKPMTTYGPRSGRPETNMSITPIPPVCPLHSSRWAPRSGYPRATLRPGGSPRNTTISASAPRPSAKSLDPTPTA